MLMGSLTQQTLLFLIFVFFFFWEETCGHIYTRQNISAAEEFL